MSEDKEIFDDDISMNDDDDADELESVPKDGFVRKTDALRRIEEYRRMKELRNQMSFFDDEYDSKDDYLSEI